MVVRDHDQQALRALYRGVWHALSGGRDTIEPEPRAQGIF
jgi:hypothetical protein